MSWELLFSFSLWRFLKTEESKLCSCLALTGSNSALISVGVSHCRIWPEKTKEMYYYGAILILWSTTSLIFSFHKHIFVSTPILFNSVQSFIHVTLWILLQSFKNIALKGLFFHLDNVHTFMFQIKINILKEFLDHQGKWLNYMPPCCWSFLDV